MNFKRKTLEILCKSNSFRDILRRAYYSLIKYDNLNDGLPSDGKTIFFTNVASNSFYHFEIVAKFAKELSIKPCGRELKRFGSSNDGGYVMVPPTSIDYGILSLGVGENISWDEELSRNAKFIHLYDHTVEHLPIKLSNAKLFREKIGSTKESGSTSISTAMSRFQDTTDLILKIDIEGSEWIALEEIDSRDLNEFSQVIIEFHGLHEIILGPNYEAALDVLKKLNATHLAINFHPNNYSNFSIIGNHPVPDIFEVTYLRRDQVNFTLIEEFSLIDNKPNNQFSPEIILQFPAVSKFAIPKI